MAKNENIKRLGLYFNLENEHDNRMWAYLETKRKKPDEIKRLIELAMNGMDIEPIEISKSDDDKIDKDEIDPSIGALF